jgi:tetratricopeptide (TPR) repeat protein
MIEGLPNSSTRWTAIVIAVAAAAWLCYAGVKHGLAGHYATSSDPGDWSSAARIEPADPENWYRLGRYRQLDFDHEDLPLAISFYRRAVLLNPRSPYYKLDLASALEMSGNNAEADQYFRAAQKNYPISSEISWKYGNFLLRQQRLPEAYAEIRRAVEVDPKLIPQAVSRAWHSDADVHVLLDQVLPNTVEGDWSALSFLTDAHEVTAALTIWNHLIGRKPAIDWNRTFAFTDMLVAQERYDEAGSVWHQSTDLAGTSSPASKGGSLVFDGGFEKELSGGGFGWREEDVPGADFAFDIGEKHSGTRSASIAFDGTQNLAYQNLYQSVLVTPGTHYRFRGYLRTDKISTDSGMRFEIFDPKDMNNLDVLTPNVTGTQPWTLEETDFTPGPKTRLIRIRVTRTPSQRLDNKLNGTVWVDDVELVPAASTK